MDSRKHSFSRLGRACKSETLFAACLALALSTPAVGLAGTLCGTVHDQQTGASVARAGVFLRRPTGEYAGLYGATDAMGSFCIGNVPPATYDVEVLRDGYQVAYLRGVVVTGSNTDVEIPAGRAGLELAVPSPNPARAATRLSWTMPVAGRVRLTVCDLAGRPIRGWWSERLEPGVHAVTWDLVDASGRAVGPGLYFVRLDAGPIRQVRRLAIVR